jgi:tetratricopeptide (TPR) repeat protein
MSQAFARLAADPPPLSPRPRRLRLLLIPLAIALVVIAIPGGLFGFAQNELSQAQASEAEGNYAQALGQFQTVENIAGNPVAGILLGELSDKARAGAAETHFTWGTQLERSGHYADAETQLRDAVKSGIADWQTRANEGLADLFLTWGQAAVASKDFQAGIDKYHQVASFDAAGNLAAKTSAELATAYAGYAQAFTEKQPPDYPTAVSWYQDLIKMFADSPEAKQAQATLLPQSLFNAGLAYLKNAQFQQARDAMNQVVQAYAATTWATQAKAALSAPQTLTGKLVISGTDPTPIAHRLVRISTKWRIVRAHTYDDSGGKIYGATTDANGVFTVVMPPGQNYLVTWWDPARSTFVTTFLSDNVPVNQVTIEPLQPAQTTVAST